MIEYLYDAIRATAGEEIAIAVVITDDLGEAITEGCSFTVYSDECALYTVEGEYITDFNEWLFNVPAEITEGKKGRFWYSIGYHGVNLSFKQPLYLV